MSTRKRSRHIPANVTAKLLRDARHRCCICRVLIDPEKYDSEALFGSLEKHHIHNFSDDGGHTYDNLLLVCANCHNQILKVEVDPEVIDPEEKEMLEDLVAAAVNQALENAQKRSQEEMSKVSGGLLGNLPGGFKIPGM